MMLPAALICPQAHEMISHNVGVKAHRDLIEFFGADNVKSVDVAIILADALADALFVCALNGVDQDGISDLCERVTDGYQQKASDYSFKTAEVTGWA